MGVVTRVATPATDALAALDNEDQDDEEQPPTDDGQDGAHGAPEDDADPEGADQLGDAGKRALDAMKGRFRAERDRRRELEQQIADATATTEAEKTQRAAERAALDKANRRILQAEIRAAAKGLLADPGDAFAFLDLDAFEVATDGSVDTDDISSALADLVKTKPYLSAQRGGGPQWGPRDGGTAKPPRPRQLTETDLDGMSPEQIVAAEKAGQLETLLGR
ncbi:hypothetical protein ACN20G_28215 (plasmid) [Streptomyces sp. BI20]|uniref:hypothetical protein n=1 Tax=Streptomyces sp. BI20 TaxID=3403460 RepID=UPI003C74931D